MKTITLASIFFVASFLSFAQLNTLQDITVTIENIRNDTGKVLLSLHTESTFLKSKGLQAAESTIKNGKITITFKNVAPGTYAIIAMHDENENNLMDFDAHGMPLEDYGTSNNPLSYGPPQYSDAKFQLESKPLKLNIRF